MGKGRKGGRGEEKGGRERGKGGEGVRAEGACLLIF